jgi:hypothetical protein
MIKEILQTLKQELKKELLLWNFTYNILDDRAIKINWISFNFYIEWEYAIICPFQQIEIELEESEQLLFFQLLVWKWLNYNSKEKAILEIKRLAEKFNLNINNL